MRISLSTLGFIIFLLILPMDALATLLERAYGFNIPLGMIGIMIAFFSAPLMVNEKGFALKLLLVFFLLFLALVIPVSVSSESGLGDYYFWARAAALFYAGFFFGYWIWRGPAQVSFLFICLLFLLLLFVSHFFSLQDMNYLRLSNGALILSFLLLSVVRSKYLFLIVCLISLVTLYNFESRFSLIAFSLSVFFLLFLQLRSWLKLLYLFFVTIISFLLYWVGYYLTLDVNNIHNYRLLRLIYASDQDTSLNARSNLLSDATDVFLNNPLLGSYRYYADSGVGDYAHNFMSFWSELGLFGIIFSSMVLAVSLLTLKLVTKLKLDSFGKFLILINTCLILGVVFAKSYHWQMIYYFSGINIFYISRLYYVKEPLNKLSRSAMIRLSQAEQDS